ncbi:MAG: hypothetical protein NTY12_04270 [Candidatus Falkowbacteria bacterium]|nr:hypothetical protein [Candidatus Falkowbacteria bacterium]
MRSLENFDQVITRKIEQTNHEEIKINTPIMWSFWIRLKDWQTEREVRVQDGYAYFEVAEESRCSLSQIRIASIRSLDRNDIRYAYLYNRHPIDGPTLWAGIRVHYRAGHISIINQLRNKLSLRISGILL